MQETQQEDAASVSCIVRLEPAGFDIEIEKNKTLLEGLLEKGVNYTHGCKHGICGACKAKVTSGLVDCGPASEFALTEEEREGGYVLLCCSVAQSDHVLIEGPL